MALCFLELVKMAIAIKKISNITDYNFKKQCIKIYNKYWKQFDILTYLLVYFLYPKYRGMINYILVLNLKIYKFL